MVRLRLEQDLTLAELARVCGLAGCATRRPAPPRHLSDAAAAAAMTTQAPAKRAQRCPCRGGETPVHDHVTPLSAARMPRRRRVGGLVRRHAGRRPTRPHRRARRHVRPLPGSGGGIGPVGPDGRRLWCRQPCASASPSAGVTRQRAPGLARGPGRRRHGVPEPGRMVLHSAVSRSRRQPRRRRPSTRCAAAEWRQPHRTCCVRPPRVRSPTDLLISHGSRRPTPSPIACA